MDYYCSQKFWWITVEPERRSIASCCQATSSKIDLTWLKKNPNQLFNSPKLQEERQAMLDNKPVRSCETSCFVPELNGLPSRRTMSGSDAKTYTSLVSEPTHLHIVLSSDCNLTCSYCTRQYSTSWIRDLVTNGEYFPDNRFNITPNDKILLKLGQKAISESNSYNLILDQVKNYKKLERVILSGGEPFLYNGLNDLVNQFDCEVEIYTGMGVNKDRFQKILSKLPSNVFLSISAENTGSLYEFNRFGNSYDQFLSNLQAIEHNKIKYRFSSVISNLTIHGYADFLKQFSTPNDCFTICADPDFLAPNLIDDSTKNIIKNTVYKYQDNDIKQSIDVKYSNEQKNKLSIFLKEFARRRSLSLSVFPDSFVDWLYGTKSN